MVHFDIAAIRYSSNLYSHFTMAPNDNDPTKFSSYYVF